MKIKLQNLKIDTLFGGSVAIQSKYSGDERNYEFEYAGFHFEVKDIFEKNKTVYKLTRRISAKKSGEVLPGAGIAFSTELRIGDGTQRLRIGGPSVVYAHRIGKEKCGYCSFMEDRLPGAVMLFYDEETKESVTVQKTVPAIHTEKEVRETGQNRYLHKTEVTSMGYGSDDCAFAVLCWPYEERETSVALDSGGTYVKAYYPLEEPFEMELSYIIESKTAPSFTEALYEGYRDLAGRLESSQYAKTAEIPSAGKREWNIEEIVSRKHIGSLKRMEQGFSFTLIHRKDTVRSLLGLEPYIIRFPMRLIPMC